MYRALITIVLFLFLGITGNTQQTTSRPVPGKKLNVLVFSKTNEYRHASISNGLKMFSELAQTHQWQLTCTESASLLGNAEFLSAFDVVVFLNPSGTVFTEPQRKIFERVMKTGKGFVGLHAAADCEHDWPWYGKLNGAYFRVHPPAQEGTIIIENHNHPAMQPFRTMKSYTTVDEWYSFKESPRGKVNVLARLDESSIRKQENDDWRMGDHPVIWSQETDGIRSFYTVFGHTPEAFDDPNIREHIAGAVNWAGKRVD